MAQRSMSPALTTEPALSGSLERRSPMLANTPVTLDEFGQTTISCLQLFRQQVSSVVAVADKGVLDALDLAKTQYTVLVQQCAHNPDQYERCLQETLKICQHLKAQLLHAENNLAQRLQKPLASYYSDLVCACREQCMGYSHNNPGRNLAVSLQAYMPLVQHSVRQQRTWLDAMCAQRTRDIGEACDRLAGEVQQTLDEGSLVDGSVTDLLSNLDDVMSVVSSCSQQTCGSTTAAAYSV